MPIGLVYERANKDAYDLIKAAQAALPASELAGEITTEIFPTILKKVGDTFMRNDVTDRNYSKFKLPLTEFGAITEYISSSMVRADDPTPIATGTVVDDMVINNPKLFGRYIDQLVRANYPLTVNGDRWLDAMDNGRVDQMASYIAVAMQSLYDGIAHDHDSFIPALLGSMYTQAPESSIRRIPTFNGTNVEDYAKSIFGTLNKAIRDMTQWRRPDFNMVGADMSDSKSDLVLVSFDSPASDQWNQTLLDIITSQLNIGAMARATALGSSLGVEVYEMPTPGIIESSVSRAYGIPAFPGMQTADTLSGVLTPPHPNVKFALIGRGALNVGLKRLQQDTGRSIRGHFDQTWVQPTLQLAYGTGQAIFFIDGDDPDTGARVATTTTTAKTSK